MSQQKEISPWRWRRKRKSSELSNVLNCDTNLVESFSNSELPNQPSPLRKKENLFGSVGTNVALKRSFSRKQQDIKMNKQLLSTVILYTCIALFTTSTYSLPLNTTSQKEQLREEARDATGNSVENGQPANAIAPTIDYSHNMRILKLPRSTSPGSLVYRLKGSDGDPNSQLSFGVSGAFGLGRTLLDVMPVAHSWNEADVYLRSELELPLYNLTVYVTDGNKTTQVESTLIVTDDIEESAREEFSASNNTGTRNSNLLSPFVNPRHVFNIPENTKLGEPIGYVTVMESSKSDLPVRFELRGRGSEKFAIKYVFGPKGHSKGEIILARELDYEKQNLFSLKVLALNAWTNSRLDTRNVATLDIVITVGDLQDTPPVFRSLPRSINLANNLEANSIVGKVEAEDGDYADQRPVQYALDANSPLASYFSINKATGEIHLLRPAAELALHAAWDSADWSLLTVFASELSDTSSYDHLWPPMYARAEVPLRLVDVANEPPQFVGGWQTQADPNGSKLLHGYLDELILQDSSQHLVTWFTNATETGQPFVDQLIKSMSGRPLVLDLGLGVNGTFELSLEGPDKHLFQLEPQFPVVKQTTFSLAVNQLANRSQFDFDTTNSRRSFLVDIVARDFGQPDRKSARISCKIELLDANDNSPHFDSDLYTFNVYENAQPGTLLGTIKARDSDSPENSRIRYNLVGFQEGDKRQSELFHLDPENGQLTLRGQLDREKRSSFLLLVEAHDGSGNGNFTQLLVNVFDVNDNAPQFLQSHYDAVLLADGTFHQPLIVRALDGDEPNTANSQVAYEIIAGNANEQFSIDSVSGVIYPTIFGSAGPPAGEYLSPPNKNVATALPQIPPLLSEPIVPFNQHNNQAGKILPSHEVEDASGWRAPRLQADKLINKLDDWNHTGATTSPSSFEQERQSEKQKASISVEIRGAGSVSQQRPTSQVPLWFRKQLHQQQTSGPPLVDAEQLPALDLLLNMESKQPFEDQQESSHVIEGNDKRRSLPIGSGSAAGNYQPPNSNLLRVPPITTLIVRAHDFGIPIRSSTVRVNIFNQALLSRSISVILNGTADQLELRREAIERAFSSVTGSKANIESIDALSESSSISIARVRLTVPQHSLVDLTDLSALMSAIDYKPSDATSGRQPAATITHYVNEAGKLVPINHQGPLAGLPTANITHHGNQQTSNGFYTDVHSYQLDDGQQLERKLLIYIIIVVVCIAILLLIWIVYYCTRENRDYGDRSRQLVADERKARKLLEKGIYRPEGQETAKTTPKSAETGVGATNSSPITNQLGKFSQKQLSSQERGSTTNNSELLLTPEAANNKYLAVAGGPVNTTTTNFLKPEHMSMYNGQVWFEPSSGSGPMKGTSARRARLSTVSRRASSAPSGNSLDSVGLNPELRWPGGSRDASGQFFPNTLGYMENLDALSMANPSSRLASGNSSRRLGFNGVGRKHRVAPLVKAPIGHLNEAFEPDYEENKDTRKALRKNASSRHKHANRRQTSSTRSASSVGGSSLSTDSNAVVLDSDQELLGFDSTGTPIIATHTQPANGRPLKTLVVDMPEPAEAVPAARRKSTATSTSPTELKDDHNAAEKESKPEEKGEPSEQNGRSSPNRSVDRLQRQKANSQGDLMGELNGKLAARRKQSDGTLEDNKLAGSEVSQTRTRPIGRTEPVRSESSGGESNNSAENPDQTRGLANMKNGELLEKQSIFAITYSGLATDKLPV